MTTSRPMVLLALAVFAAPSCTQTGADPGLAAVERSLSNVVATLAHGAGEQGLRRKNAAFWERAETGTTFVSGDWVKTADRGYARIEFVAGGRLDLDENAMVVVERTGAQSDDPAAPSETLVAIESGSLGGLLEKEDQVLVIRSGKKASARLVPAKGSAPLEYRLTRKASATEVAVRRGAATLFIGGKESSIRAGEAADIEDETTATPRPPVITRLLVAPVDLRPAAGAHLPLPANAIVPLSWAPAEGAQGYRVQVARDAAFRELVARFDTTSESGPFTGVVPGRYFWRVSAKDAAERWGEFSPGQALVVDPPLVQDRLLHPLPNAKISWLDEPLPVSFAWEKVPDATAYRLRVGRRADLEKDPLIDVEAGGAELDVPGLGVGEYYWGVYARVGEWAPIFPAPRRFTVVKAAKTNMQTPKNITNWGD